MEDEIYCEACGHAIIEYSFNINQGLCSVLIKLYEAGGPIEIAKLRLTNSQYSNYPKLAYWGLAERHTIDEDAKGGVWKITRKGLEFITGSIAVSKRAVMKNKQLIRFDGDAVKFDEIIDGYDYKPFYKAQARFQFNGMGQGELLL